MKFRRAFTIVELMMVIAIIATLMGLITGASVAAMRSARGKRTEAMRVALEASIATWQAQDPNGKWPGAIEDMAQNAQTGVLSADQAQRVFRLIVQKSTGASGAMVPLIDPSALFVAPSGVKEGKGTGVNFPEARAGGAHRAKLPVANMVFGYQGVKTGKFHSFNITYNAKTDRAYVSACCDQCITMGGCSHPANSNNPCPICHKNEK